ncbi:MAG: DUF58 domain-containing protein [Candidatus Marinimicrobia bacterium]|nr:DUF58 domain-containing protein [Candidatus Neomarinimicrobiota bacterium]
MARSEKTKYLDPEIISKMDNMALIARLVVEGFIVGLHKSPYHGFSVEFAEHRPYMPGDEIKDIDWKVYGKTDRYYIKQYEEETNLRSYIFLDKSGSMGYSSGPISKLDYGKYLAASMAYLMLQQQDAISLTTFDSKVDQYYPPFAKRSHLNRILAELEKTKHNGEGNISNFLHERAEKINKRGLIILISDLFEKPENIIKALKHFRHYNHEIIVFNVLDKQEKNFEFNSQTKFIDMENKNMLETEPWHIQKDYKQLIQKHIDKLRSICRNNNIDYIDLTTDQDLSIALTEYLNKRAKLS